MKKQLILLILSACFISACTTYQTNSKTTFKSTLLSGQEPVIHVGEITEKPDKLVLLGWVEASVAKPSMFAKNPTAEQANIILAEKGDALGADAIIYVTYKTRIGSLFLEKIEARGQAVKLKDNSAQLEGIKKKRPALQLPPAIESAATAEPDNTTIESNEALLKVSETPAPTILKSETGDNAKINEANIPSTVEEAIKIKATSEPKSSAPISLKVEVAQKSKEKELMKLHELAEQAKSCEPTINDMAEYESNYDALNYLLMNADFLLKKSRGLKDEEMENASLRVAQLLEQQLEKLKANKPVLVE